MARSSAGGGRLLGLALVGILLFFVGLEFGRRRAPDGAPDALAMLAGGGVSGDETKKAPVASLPRLPAVGRDATGPEEPLPRIAVVIDDLGRDLDSVRRLQALPVPITFAVLPFESRTPEVVAHLRRDGEEILCHLPMEAGGSADPGPGALTLAMSSVELQERTRAALDAVGGAVGANNHMGSALSSDRLAMLDVLGVVAERGLFFLDSRTSADTVAYDVAGEVGVEAAERQVFLDRDRSVEAIGEQFDRLLEVADLRGEAIAIGHPYPETLAVLEERTPAALAAGYRFVVVSRLVGRPSP